MNSPKIANKQNYEQAGVSEENNGESEGWGRVRFRILCALCLPVLRACSSCHLCCGALSRVLPPPPALPAIGGVPRVIDPSAEESRRVVRLLSFLTSSSSSSSSSSCVNSVCLNGVGEGGMRRSRNQWRKTPFHWMRERHSVNEGFGKEFYRKDNSLKRFRPFSESPNSKNSNLWRHPIPKSLLLYVP